MLVDYLSVFGHSISIPCYRDFSEEPPTMLRERQRPVTLKNACLGVLTDMLWVWGHERRRRIDNPSHLDEALVYLKLPGALTRDLLKIMKTRQKLLTHHAAVLLRLGLNNLDLCGTFVDVNALLHLTAKELQHVTHLDISYRYDLSITVLLRLPKFLDRVQVLNLSYTNSNDEVLDTVAFHCPLLQELNLKGCAISDHGITCLHNPANPLPHLVRLCITRTGVSIGGAAQALRAWPTLEELDYEHLGSALMVNTDKSYKAAIPCSYYNLRVLEINLRDSRNSQFSVSSQILQVAVSCCPQLSHVIVKKWTSLPITNLPELSRLKHLTMLELNCPSVPFSDIITVLQARGQQLINLGIGHFVDVQVSIISKYCIRVNHMTLYDNTYEEESSGDYHFPELLFLRQDGNVPIHILKNLLSSCTLLKTLIITNCANFSDELLQTVLLKNQLSNLHKIYVSGCNRISTEGLNLVIPEKTPLIKTKSSQPPLKRDFFKETTV